MLKQNPVANYKNLVVYQKSRDFSIETIEYFSGQKTPNNLKFLENQLLRASCSIAANIAEGYGRHYQKSFRQFLAIARGSSFESEHWLEVMLTVPTFDKLKIKNLIEKNQE